MHVWYCSCFENDGSDDVWRISSFVRGLFIKYGK